MQDLPPNPLPGVPLVESPLFRQFFNEDTCDRETLRIAHDLHTHGCALLDFPDPEIATRAARIRQALHGRYDWAAWRERRLDSLRIQDAWEFDADVKAIAVNPRMLALLSRLYGRPAFAFQTLNFPVGTGQPLHRDSYHFGTHPDRFVCGVWVALEDVDLGNGPPVDVPGSHAWPVYGCADAGTNAAAPHDEAAQARRMLTVWSASVSARGAEVRPRCVRQGQALLWAAHLIHGGDKQRDRARTRWSQLTHYTFDGCCHYAPARSEPFFGRIQFREVRDIATGRRIPQQLAGEELPRDVINGLRPRPADARDEEVNRRLGLPEGFDPEVYLRLNPDVRAAGLNPRQHYLDHGRHEGRAWR